MNPGVYLFGLEHSLNFYVLDPTVIYHVDTGLSSGIRYGVVRQLQHNDMYVSSESKRITL